MCFIFLKQKPPLNEIQWLGHLNDLWKFRMNDSTWTWISGSNTVNQPGVYIEIGYASVNNIPGARYSAVTWYDSSRKEVWLFGGSGFGNTSLYGT